ncbi:MAG: HAD family hydrolase [Lachnospiraceae bacterium]|nr:HAD family hydrolase [Lachnospiraceae bacterium]
MTVFDHKAVVWDLDGTLYYQRKMRIKMGLELLTYYILHPLSLKELLAVKKFREVREKWEELEKEASSLMTEAIKGADDFIEAHGDCDILSARQYLFVAKSLNMDSGKVKNAIDKWIYERPLDIIYKCRDDEAAELIGRLDREGIDNYIFSDYPIEDKLTALKIKGIKGTYAATDERVGVLKPDPKGLCLIMKDHGLLPSEIIMIGDRMSRDGEAAKKAGCDYIILSKSRSERAKQYRDMYK